MHIIWSGAINFGLVSIPIKLYPGAQDQQLHFHLLHNSDKSPIRYAKFCRAENKAVDSKQIVKGYEYEKDTYVILTEQDFAKVDIKATHTIDVLEFVEEKDIDSRLYQTPYYLEPDKHADVAYVLLREAMKRSKKVAVAKIILHQREHLAILKTVGDALILNLIRFATEIRDLDALTLPAATKINPQQMEVAQALIKQLSGKFHLNKFKDTYTEKLQQLIADKLKGKKITAKGKMPKETAVKDLMSVLKASLKKTQTKAKPAVVRKKSKVRKKAA